MGLLVLARQLGPGTRAQFCLASGPGTLIGLGGAALEHDATMHQDRAERRHRETAGSVDRLRRCRGLGDALADREHGIVTRADYRGVRHGDEMAWPWDRKAHHMARCRCQSSTWAMGCNWRRCTG